MRVHDSDTITIEAIGTVRAGRSEALDDWGGTRAVMELAERFEPDALAGLEGFSHVEVLFHFDRVGELDAIDGTPVIDLKPVMQEFLPRGEVVQPAWTSELMQHHWRTPAPGSA